MITSLDDSIALYEHRWFAGRPITQLLWYYKFVDFVLCFSDVLNKVMLVHGAVEAAFFTKQ
jgi:hypothetical protein